VVSETLELRCGALSARIHASEPALELQYDGGSALRLASDAPGWRGPALVARGRVKTRAGPVQQLELQTPGRGALASRWTVALAEDGSCALLDLVLENRGTSPRTLGRLRPLRVEAPAVRATPCDLLGSPAEQGAWLQVGDAAPWLAAFVRPGQVAGGWPGDDPRQALEDHGGESLAPGGVLRAGRLWLAAGPSRWRLREDWARWAGAELQASPPHRGVFAQRETSAPSQRGLGAVGALLPVADPLAAAHLAGRLFGLEVEVAEEPDFEAYRSRTALAALCSAALVSHQPLARMAEPRRRFLQRCIPPLARAPERLDEALVSVSLAGGRKLVWLGNPAREARELGLPLERLGCTTAQHGFDFFAGRPLGRIAGEVPPATVAAGGCRLLALTPEAPRAQVIGTTLHVGMGALEVVALRAEPTGLRLLLRHPGRHAGDVWIAHPDGSLQRVPVAFENDLELAVPPPGAA
jgi:hypothetical protein